MVDKSESIKFYDVIIHVGELNANGDIYTEEALKKAGEDFVKKVPEARIAFDKNGHMHLIVKIPASNEMLKKLTDELLHHIN